MNFVQFNFQQGSQRGYVCRCLKECRSCVLCEPKQYYCTGMFLWDCPVDKLMLPFYTLPLALRLINPVQRYERLLQVTWVPICWSSTPLKEGMFGMLVGGFSGQVITLLLPRHVSRCVEHLNVWLLLECHAIGHIGQMHVWQPPSNEWAYAASVGQGPFPVVFLKWHQLHPDVRIWAL